MIEACNLPVYVATYRKERERGERRRERRERRRERREREGERGEREKEREERGERGERRRDRTTTQPHVSFANLFFFIHIVSLSQVGPSLPVPPRTGTTG